MTKTNITHCTKLQYIHNFTENYLPIMSFMKSLHGDKLNTR